jgi:hypothetical protein
MNTSGRRHSTALKGQLLLGSFLSALAGWVSVMLIEIIFSSITYWHSDSVLRSTAWWYSPGFYAVLGAVAGAFIFGIWLVLLVPLYVLVPVRSVLWYWPVSTVCGTVSGATIMLVFCHLNSPQADWKGPTLLAAIAGGIACLFASLTRKWFRYVG